MPTAWFRVRETTRTKYGSEETVPEHVVSADTTAISCARLGQSPNFVCHVRAPASVLEGLRDTPGVTELPEAAALTDTRSSSHVDERATTASFRV